MSDRLDDAVFRPLVPDVTVPAQGAQPVDEAGTVVPRTLLIVDDVPSLDHLIDGMLRTHPDVREGRLLFETAQVTSPDDIPIAVERARADGGTYDVALVDLDFGARRAGGERGHGLTALRLLAETSPDTRTALYTADVEGNRELMLRAAFELCPHTPVTWISKSLSAADQAEAICALLDGRDPPLGHLRPYWNRPEHLKLRVVCSSRTQLRMWQALALGFDHRGPIASHAGVSESTLDKFVASVREFIVDCMPPTGDPGTDARAGVRSARSANLALAARFAYVNRSFFADPELERLVAR
ncbi:hypothetical protein ACWGN5_20450 [Streptomyces sp. NPDC055815]